MTMLRQIIVCFFLLKGILVLVVGSGGDNSSLSIKSPALWTSVQQDNVSKSLTTTKINSTKQTIISNTTSYINAKPAWNHYNSTFASGLLNHSTTSTTTNSSKSTLNVSSSSPQFTSQTANQTAHPKNASSSISLVTSTQASYVVDMTSVFPTNMSGNEQSTISTWASSTPQLFTSFTNKFINSSLYQQTSSPLSYFAPVITMSSNTNITFPTLSSEKKNYTKSTLTISLSPPLMNMNETISTNLVLNNRTASIKQTAPTAGVMVSQTVNTAVTTGIMSSIPKYTILTSDISPSVSVLMSSIPKYIILTSVISPSVSVLPSIPKYTAMLTSDISPSDSVLSSLHKYTVLTRDVSPSVSQMKPTKTPTKDVHSSPEESDHRTALIVGLTVGLSLLILILSLIVICMRRKRASYQYNVFYDEQNIVMNPFDRPR